MLMQRPTLLVPPLRSRLDPKKSEFLENREAMLEKLAKIDELLDEAAAGGGPASFERLAKRGKLPVRERVGLVLDPDSPFLELSGLAAYGSNYTIGGGSVLGIGVIAGVECVIFANDPSVLGGARSLPTSARSGSAPFEIARDNHMPYVSFVESAGADLRVRTDGKKGESAGSTGASLNHFAESGRFFYEMIELVESSRSPLYASSSDPRLPAVPTSPA